jgi:hypothetical protein
MRLLACIVAAFCCAPFVAARAQPTLTITSSSTIDLPVPSGAEYEAGHSLVGRITFAVTGCTSPSQRCTLGLWAATPWLAPGKSVSDVEWQLDGTADGRWQPLTPVPSDANVGVVSGPAVSSGTLYFRMRLSWNNDPAGESCLAAVRLTLTDR